MLIVLVAIGVVLVVFIMVYSAMTFQTKKKKMSEQQRFRAFNKRFNFYYDFSLTRTTFRKQFSQIQSLSVYTYMEARIITVQFFERSLKAAILLFIVGYVGLGDIISGIVLLLFAIVMLNTTVNNRIDDVNYQTLKAMSQFILSLRESYTRVRNVPDAVNDAKCPPILKQNVDDIYLIITATDGESRLKRFYQTCPNRTMRTLATTCYVRADSGEDDLPPGKESPFKMALSLIKDEVDMEAYRQLNQRLMFKGLDKLTFIPMLMYPVIVMVYKRMFSATTAVFESAIGYVIKLVTILACFVCYYILSSINNSSVARTDDRMDFLVSLTQRFPVLDELSRRLVTKKGKVRMATTKKLEGCISKKDLPYFYLEKNFFAAVLFVASHIFTVLILLYAKGAVYNGVTVTSMSVTLTYTTQEMNDTLAYDAKVLAMDSCPSYEELYQGFEDIFRKYSDLELQTQAERLQTKYETYHNLHYYWWFALISIGAWFAGFFIPDMLLKLRMSMVKSESEMDVLQLQTVIAVLMDTNLDTLSVLGWLAQASDIHKDILQFCYHEYVRWPEHAIQRLQLKSASAEFSSMCEKLLTTISQVSLAEAFEDLVSERQTTMKNREVVQLEQLKSKRSIAGPVAMAPMGVWMVAVFLLPVAIVAVRSFTSMMGQLDF